MTLRTLRYLIARLDCGDYALGYLGRPWLESALARIEAVTP